MYELPDTTSSGPLSLSFNPTLFAPSSVPIYDFTQHFLAFHFSKHNLSLEKLPPLEYKVQDHFPFSLILSLNFISLYLQSISTNLSTDILFMAKNHMSIVLCLLSCV